MWFHIRMNGARHIPVATVLLFIFLFPMNGVLFAQAAYPKGMIFLKDGMSVEGKDLQIGTETAIMTVGSQVLTYNLTDVQQIMTKRGLGKRIGMYSGGGCFVLAVASYLATGGEAEDAYGNTVEVEIGQYLVGTALWVAIFSGAGYLVGMLLDQWQVVYVSP